LPAWLPACSLLIVQEDITLLEMTGIGQKQSAGCRQRRAPDVQPCCVLLGLLGIIQA